jgi:uncharacterized membrane protein
LITIKTCVFDDPENGQKMLNFLVERSNYEPINLEDLAIVIWELDHEHPKTKQIDGAISQSVLSGAFWGLLFSKIFFIPSFGMAVSAAMGSLAGKFATYGISNHFCNSVGEQVSQGTSALFMMGTEVQVEKIDQAAKQEGLVYESISAELSDEQAKQLLQDFGAE